MIDQATTGTNQNLVPEKKGTWSLRTYYMTRTTKYTPFTRIASEPKLV